jgi:ABC-type multidrug transport system fused ATPase/permease subunit
VLDDVLGGLDPATEQKVVDSVFGRHGFLKHHNMAALLVTHSFHHARHADQVVVMGPGGIVLEQGSPDSVSLFKKVNEDNAQDIARVLGSSENLVSATDGEPIQQQHGHLQQQNEMMQEELSRQTGDMRLYAYYMSAIGWFNAIGLLVGLATYTVLLKFPSLLVRWWSDAEANTPGRQTNQYMGIYGMICGLCLVTFCLAEYTIFFRGIPRSSNSLHKKLLDAVLNAPYWFFVATDTGQLVNRFSQDMSLLCLDLPFAFVDTIFNAGNAIVGAVLITLASTYSLAICPALAVILYVLQKFYLLTSRQMRLLDLEAKSPLYTHFIQTLHGVTTIRAFGWQHASSAENAELLDRSQRPFYLMYSIQRWLNLVLDLLVAGVATLVVCLSTQLDNSSPGALGVSLLNIVTFSQDLTYLVRTWTDLETSLGAMARVRDFERNTPSEHLSNEQSTVPQDWPTGGEISIKDLSSSYKYGTIQAILHARWFSH